MSPPSNKVCAELAQAAYKGPWKYQDHDVRAIEEVIDGYTCIAFEGTTLDGWAILRDIRFMPWWHHRVGFCPAGFLKGVVDVMDEITLGCGDAARDGKLVIAGHSLGAAEAAEAAGWFCALGYPPAKLALFAPPYPGSHKLRRLIQQIPDRTAWRYGNDPVPCVPRIPGLYVQPLALTPLGHPCADPIHAHRIAGYVEEVTG